MQGYYEVKFHVDEIDLTRYLKQVDIITHGSTLVPVINLVLEADIFDVITIDNLKANAKLTIITKLNESKLIQSVFPLVLITTIKNIPQRNPNDQQKRITPSTIELEVSDKNAINAATTLINYANSYITLEQVLAYMASKAGLKLQLLTPINNQVYKNIVIPPLSLNQSLIYLQQTYGITQGPLLKIINYKKELVIADCSKLINTYSKPLVIFTRRMGSHLSTELKRGGIQTGQDLEFRYAFRNDPEVHDTLAQRLLRIKPKQLFICHPLDRFYQFREMNTSDISKKYSISKQQLNIQSLQLNEAIVLDYTTYSYNDLPINKIGEISRELTNAKNITGHLEIFKNQNHFLYIPGEHGFVAHIKSSSIPEIAGTYILASTHLSFAQEQYQHWSYELQISLRG